MRRLAAALLASITLAAAAADAPGNLALDDLKIRSAGGDREATRTLAEAYYLGRGGVEQDFPEAARWYRRLATQGDARAQTSLGLMYARGLGFPRDMVEARRWWSLAAAQNDAGAQYNLGTVYFEGHGVEADLPQAHFWFTRAALRGHVLAQTNAGAMSLQGRGVPRDPVTGLAWLMIAAGNGEEKAQELLKTLAPSITPEVSEKARERMKALAGKPR
jgi:TPR repeat protein